MSSLDTGDVEGSLEALEENSTPFQAQRGNVECSLEALEESSTPFQARSGNDSLEHRLFDAIEKLKTRFKQFRDQFRDQFSDSLDLDYGKWVQQVLKMITRLNQWRKDLDESTRKRILLACAFTVLGIVGYRRKKRSALLSKASYQSATEAPLSLLYRAAREGQIERALLGSSGVFFLLNGDWKRSILPPNLMQKDLLETLSTCPDVAALPESLSSRLATPVLAALPFVYLALLYRLMRNMTGGDDIRSTLHSQSSTTFQDVAGLDDVVADVSEVVTYLQDPTQYVEMGARPPRGILLYGPPGSGKTLLAQAVAGEANVDCFLACSASDFVEVYVGRGAARVRSLFAQARREARRKTWWDRLRTNRSQKPSAILFIDELDALAKTRSTLSSNDEREQTLNQLLTEMDGFANESDVTLIVIAASNRVDVLDPAALRRFDRQTYVGYPDANGRKAILQVHARRISYCRADVNWDELASEKKTGGFSGSDLRNLINDAALLAVRDRSPSVHQGHLEHAARRLMQMKWRTGGSPNTPVNNLFMPF